MFRIERLVGSAKLCGEISKKYANSIEKFKATLLLPNGTSFEQIFVGRVSNEKKPLLLFFHGHGGALLADYFYDLDDRLIPEFNLLFPQDRSGCNRSGSAFLGGKGPVNWPYPIITKCLLDSLDKELHFSDVIFCGCSMGGYGAIMNSLFYKNSLCFTSVPQTSLDPTNNYYRRDRSCFNYIKEIGLDSNYDTLLDSYPMLNLCTLQDQPVEINLCGVPSLILGLPDFVHITATSYDSKPEYKDDYLTSFILPFVENLRNNNKMISLNILPIVGHDLYFEPNSVAIYYLKNFSKYNLANKNVFSYKELVHEHLFEGPHPFL